MHRSAPGVAKAYLAGYKHGRRTDYFMKSCPYNLTSTQSRQYHDGFIQGTTARINDERANLRKRAEW